MSTTNAVISRMEIMQAANEIEPLPAALTRLLALLGDDNFQVSELVEILSHDPALAGDVLGRANSAASGAIRHIGDLRQAVARLGTREIVAIAMRRAMRSQFAVALPAYGLDADALWQHCITASVAAEVIRRQSPHPVAPMIGTTALIHDVGKLVIGKCLPPTAINALFEAAERDDLPMYQAEQIVLGLDHAEVSGVVARTWGLPVSVQVALTQHHEPETDDIFTHALVLANKLAHTTEALRTALADGTLGDNDDPTEWIGGIVGDVDTQIDICGIAPNQLALLIVQIATETDDILADYA
ncbi:MAG: HDOD domain-containing protein [Actinomycetota bacterium]